MGLGNFVFFFFLNKKCFCQIWYSWATLILWGFFWIIFFSLFQFFYFHFLFYFINLFVFIFIFLFLFFDCQHWATIQLLYGTHENGCFWCAFHFALIFNRGNCCQMIKWLLWKISKLTCQNVTENPFARCFLVNISCAIFHNSFSIEPFWSTTQRRLFSVFL